MFLKEVFYDNQCCIYLIKHTVKNCLLWNIITIENNFKSLLFEYIFHASTFLLLNMFVEIMRFIFLFLWLSGRALR